jgi:uncharacterized protein (DUF427 family)
MTRERKTPDDDHPITVEREPRHVVVRSGERVIAESDEALVLREASYPPVHYIPPADVDWSLLQDSDTASYCPYKGEAGYASLATGSERIDDVLWKYDDPYPAVADIRGHVAFYPSKVEVTIS